MKDTKAIATICAAPPTPQFWFLLRVADSRKTNKEEQKCTSTGSSERKEVGVRGEGAGWNNTIKDCFISAVPTGRRWRKITEQRGRIQNVLS